MNKKLFQKFPDQILSSDWLPTSTDLPTSLSAENEKKILPTDQKKKIFFFPRISILPTPEKSCQPTNSCQRKKAWRRYLDEFLGSKTKKSFAPRHFPPDAVGNPPSILKYIYSRETPLHVLETKNNGRPPFYPRLPSFYWLARIDPHPGSFFPIFPACYPMSSWAGWGISSGSYSGSAKSKPHVNTFKLSHTIFNTLYDLDRRDATPTFEWLVKAFVDESTTAYDIWTALDRLIKEGSVIMNEASSAYHTTK